MEEINLKNLYKYFISKIFIIILIIIVSLLVGIIYTFMYQKPLYRSTTTLVLTMVNSTPYESTSISQSDITLNQKLITTYQEIIKSRRIMNKVIDNLNLSLTDKELGKMVSVKTLTDTEIISISVSSINATESRDIVNNIAKVFSEEILTYYKIQNINILDEAEVDDIPYNVSVLKQLLLSFIIGLILSLCLVFIMFYFDKTIKSVEDIEDSFGLPILGTIPYKKRGSHRE